MNDTDQKVVNIETQRLFEDSAYAVGDPRRKILGEPQARKTDPATSHEAAARSRRGSSRLIAAIRKIVSTSEVPLSQFDIARKVDADPLFRGRWDEGSIRTRVSDADLRVVDNCGISPRGQRCIRYSL